MGRKTLTVLIAARDEEEYLPLTLASVKPQLRAGDAIIVVDDGSKDATAAVAKCAGATVLRLPKPQGKARAQQAALRCITTDLVATVDADTELAPDALEQLRQQHETPHPPAGACGFVLPKETQSIWQRGRFVEYLFAQTFYKFIQSKLNAILVAPGCITCWDVATLRAHGGFPAGTVAEDMDLTMTILTSGKRFAWKRPRILFVPTAYAYTLDPPTIRFYRRQLHRWYVGFFQVLKRHWWALLTFRNPGLSAYLTIALGDTVLLYVGIPFIALSLGWGHWWLLLWGAWLFGSDAAVALVFASYKGIALARRRGAPTMRFLSYERPAALSRQGAGGRVFFLTPLPHRGAMRNIGKTLAFLPLFIATIFLNRLFFLLAFLWEVVARWPVEKLFGYTFTNWQKGH